jgi:hypothetical protein
MKKPKTNIISCASGGLSNTPAPIDGAVRVTILGRNSYGPTARDVWTTTLTVEEIVAKYGRVIVEEAGEDGYYLDITIYDSYVE